MSGFESLRDAWVTSYTALSSYPATLIAQSIVGLVFVMSGSVKVRDPARASLAMVDFGVSRRVRPAHGLALGLIELALGLLVMGLPSRLVLGAASILMAMFVLLIVRSLRIGEEFPCFCFGDSDTPLSLWTAARTTLLALLATNLWFTFESVDANFEDQALAAVAAMAVVGTLFLLGRMRQLIVWNSSVRRMT